MFWEIVNGLVPLNVDLIKESNRKYNNRRFNPSIKRRFVKSRKWCAAMMLINIMLVNSLLALEVDKKCHPSWQLIRFCDAQNC